MESLKTREIETNDRFYKVIAMIGLALFVGLLGSFYFLNLL
jgi:hypothetical protein